MGETRFNWRDGCHFIRHENGDVSVRMDTSPERYFDFGRIPAAEWVSIVHAMAEPGADFHVIESALRSGL